MPAHTWGFLPQAHWTLAPYTTTPPRATKEKNHLLCEGFLHLIHKENAKEFLLLVDGATGLDALAILLALRPAYPISITAILPYEEQHIYWEEATRERYFSLLPLCDKVTILAGKPSPKSFRDACFHIAEKSQHLLCYWDGSLGDVSDAIRKAQKQSKDMLILLPEERNSFH